MNKFSGNNYLNPAYQFDMSRSNINRIMNPSVQYFSRNEREENPVREQHKAAEGTGAGQTSGISRVSGTSTISGTSQTSDALPATGQRRSAGPVKAPAAAGNPAGESPSEEAFKLDFSSGSIINAFILSELLGKPKILRKRRW